MSLPVTPADDPLHANWPSLALAYQYPLLSTNVRLLTGQFGLLFKGQSSAVMTYNAIKYTCKNDGIPGLYRAADLYLMYQTGRELFRYVAGRGFQKFHGQIRSLVSGPKVTNEVIERRIYWTRMGTKYFIDLIMFPVLLTCTRSIILEDSMSTLQRVGYWCRNDGVPSMFNGVTCSLTASMLEEIMDYQSSNVLQQIAFGAELDMADKLVIRSAASSVVSIFTAPINFVGVVRMCQSTLPGFLEFTPLRETIKNLPWQSSFIQLLVVSLLLVLNIKLTQLKLEQKRRMEEDARTRHPSTILDARRLE